MVFKVGWQELGFTLPKVAEVLAKNGSGCNLVGTPSVAVLSVFDVNRHRSPFLEVLLGFTPVVHSSVALSERGAASKLILLFDSYGSSDPLFLGIQRIRSPPLKVGAKLQELLKRST